MAPAKSRSPDTRDIGSTPATIESAQTTSKSTNGLFSGHFFDRTATAAKARSLDAWLQQITYNLNIQLFQEITSNSSIELTTIPPEVIVRPVYYTLQNLRPFDVPV
ncbi:hypothetical protein C0995_010376 [Termitomyces sp. Mi166|nr:hypothetical protein C0995_010376 [Termitomyces sp. Mi166\